MEATLKSKFERTSFKLEKRKRLENVDLSRKGSVDSKICDLINFINAQDDFFTTSSCSGRIYLFSNASGSKKQGCNWMYISHEFGDYNEVIKTLENHTGSSVLKFESFILHVQCANIASAQKLHTAGIESGFRNSGVTISKAGRITVAVRSTLSLEVPLSNDGQVLVPNEYITYVVNQCNIKMKENWDRIERFSTNFRKILDAPKMKSAKDKRSTQDEKRKKTFPKGKHEYLQSETDFQDDKSLVLENFSDAFDAMLNAS